MTNHSATPDRTQAQPGTATAARRKARYVAVLPQFIPPRASHLAVGLLLALVHDLEGLTWFAAIILGTHSVRRLLERRQARRAVDGVTGVAVIGFGIKLGLSAR